MKKLLKIFRICDLFLLVIILTLRIYRVSSIYVPSDVFRPDYPDDGSNPFLDDLDEYKDNRHESIYFPKNEYDFKKNFSETMKDRDEERMRNFVSEHEIPKEVPTKLKIIGDLATPSPNSNIKLDFVPKQTYIQVRRYDTEVHLPRSAALAEAETAEDVLNAPRLREVVSQKKTQEVYEEQGYEDAAYDHGGYKKAGEHHESKYIPREHKTDKLDITDQSTEQAEIVHVGPYNTSDSSHYERQIITTEKSQIDKNRRIKHPKGRRDSLFRHKQNSKMKNSLRNGTSIKVDEKKPYKRLPPAHRRRKIKNNEKSTENKIMEESKFHTTKKLINELEIEPTTYHPEVSFKIFNIFKPTNRSAHKLFIPTGIGNDGYKFENPFENFNDYNDVRPPVDHSLLSKTINVQNLRNNKSFTYYSNPFHSIKESIKYGESRDVNKLLASTERVKLKSNSKFPNKFKTFPYDLIETKKMRTEKKSNREKQPKFNFPYKIIDNTVVQPIKSTTTESNVASRFNVNRENIQKNRELIFGPPDSSPWIPITPKEMYDTQRYERKELPLIETNVNKNDEYSAKINIKKDQRFSPTYAYFAPPKIVSTSYSIQHIYPKYEQFPSKQDLSSQFKINQYQYETPSFVETTSKYNSLESTPIVEFLPSVQLDSLVQSTIPRPMTQIYSNTKNKQSFYDIITAHSSDIRGTFGAGQTMYINDPQVNQQPYHYLNISNTSDLKNTSVQNTLLRNISNLNSLSISKNKNELNVGEPFKIEEPVSTPFYAIFKEVNYSLPTNWTTTTHMSETNDEFNKLFSKERDTFLFRHPHFSRETSKLIKIQGEDEKEKANLTTFKRDVVLSNVKNDSITHLTKVSKRNDIYEKPVLVYPQDYTSSAKYVEKLTLAHFSDNVSFNPLPLNYDGRLATLANHLQENETLRFKRNVNEVHDDDDFNGDFVHKKNQNQNYEDDYSSDVENEELVNVFLGGTTTEIAVNVKKYPFYKTVPPDGISKYSVLRYISNPLEVPKKNVGQMTFYASKDKIECDEPSSPKDIVPSREDGEWVFDTKSKLPRVTLGDKISCLKLKFFGTDPLDNPFFKEDSVGFPEVLIKESVGNSERSEYIEPIEDFEEVETVGDYEVLPKNFFISLKQKKGERVKKEESNVSQLEEAVIQPSKTNIKSPTRRWIESLAEPQYADKFKHEYLKLYKRTPKDRQSELLSNSTNNEGHKRVQKIFYVGGFINRKNNTIVSGKSKKDKLTTTVSPLTMDIPEKTSSIAKSNAIVSGANSFPHQPPVILSYSMMTTDAKKKRDKLSKDSGKTLNNNKNEVTSDSSVMYKFPNYSQITSTNDPRKIKQFNDDLSPFFDIPRMIKFKNENEKEEEEEEENVETDASDILKIFPDVSKMKTVTSNQNENEIFYSKNKFSPSFFETINKLDKTKKKIDANDSFFFTDTSQINLSNEELKNKFEGIKYKPNYQTSLGIKNASLSSVPVNTAVFEIDSLLYVIHPKTGEGKWMKLLKIEETNDDDNINKFKLDSSSSSNHRRINVIEPPSNFVNIRTSSEDRITELPSSSSCQQEQSKIKKPVVSNHEFHPMSSLFKQVAPLKASEVEINNLQTTEKQVSSEDDELNFHSDFDDNLYTTTEFPQPHERLYYYVVDNENK